MLFCFLDIVFTVINMGTFLSILVRYRIFILFRIIVNILSYHLFNEKPIFNTPVWAFKFHPQYCEQRIHRYRLSLLVYHYFLISLIGKHR